MSSHKSSEKKTKRMNMGGRASLMAKIRSKMNPPRGAMPVRGGGGIPLQGPGGMVIPQKPTMPMKKMASGGKVRGGGAATKGLKISKKMG